MTLRLHGLFKSFGDAPVLRDVSLEVPGGSRFALVGASGSGKSTLLRLVAGFERPDAGRIDLDGRPLAGDGAWVPPHRRGIGYVPQDGALFPHLSAARNIAFGLRRGDGARRRVAELMELVSLDPSLAHRLPHELSGGQQQRVALARTLAAAPRVVLLDEPFSALDAGLRAQTRQAAVDVLERSGVTALLVTHDQDEALAFGEGLGVIVSGSLVQTGPPHEVFDAPADLGVARFLGDAVVIPVTGLGAEGARTPLGVLPVRHDRSGGAGHVQAMLRPDQLHPDPGEGGATVTAVRRSGAHADVELLAIGGDGSATTITKRIPAREAARFDPGRSARIAVEGGVVLYPAEGLGP